MHSRTRLVSVPMCVVAMLVAGCASLGNREPVEAYIVGVEPLPGAGLELRMLVKLRVQNPNDVPIKYSGVSLSMEVLGRRFASGVSSATGTIPRYGEQVIEVPVSVSAFRLVGRALEVFGKNERGEIEYELRGKLAAPAFKSVRFQSRGELTLPEGMRGADTAIRR